MKRLNHLGNILQTHWSDDPAIRGRAKMLAGAVLIAEAIFGLIRGTRTSRKGKKRKRRMGGLIGGSVLLIAGLFFLVGGLTLWPQTWDDEVETRGVIAGYATGTGSDGRPSYRPFYQFEADGREVQLRSDLRINAKPEVGEPVGIAYSASNPEQARRTDGLEARKHWIFLGGSAVLLLIALGSLTVSVVLLVFGIRLFQSGRRDLGKPRDPQRTMSDLRSNMRQFLRGEIDIESTAAGQSGSAGGD
jgi:hypothetical protein